MSTTSAGTSGGRVESGFRSTDLPASGVCYAYAAWDSDLGACALGSIGMHTDLIHRCLNLGDDVDVIAGMALGHPDHSVPGNTYRTERAELSEFVSYDGRLHE